MSGSQQGLAPRLTLPFSSLLKSPPVASQPPTTARRCQSLLRAPWFKWMKRPINIRRCLTSPVRASHPYWRPSQLVLSIAVVSFYLKTDLCTVEQTTDRFPWAAAPQDNISVAPARDILMNGVNSAGHWRSWSWAVTGLRWYWGIRYWFTPRRVTFAPRAAHRFFCSSEVLLEAANYCFLLSLRSAQQ